MNMNNFWKVTKFTVVQQVKGKAFKISTAIILGLVLILTSLINFIPAFTGKDDAKDGGPSANGQVEIGIDTAYYMDDSDLNIDLAPGLKAVFPNLKFEKAEESRATLIERLNTTEENMVLVSISNEEMGYYVEVITPSNSDIVSSDDGNILAEIISSNLNTGRLLNEGISPENVEKLSSPINTRVIAAGEENDTFEDMIIKMVFPMVACILLFYIIYFYGYWVASSIVAISINKDINIAPTPIVPDKIMDGI